jgi:opacity protein-like surface antigen
MCQRWRKLNVSRTIGQFLFLALVFGLYLPKAFAGADASGDKKTNFNLDSGHDGIWDSEVGDGFRKYLFHAGLNAGGGFGLKMFGGHNDHDVVLGNLQIGAMLSGPVAKHHLLCGNFEFLGEIFGGEQYNHYTAYFVGFVPLLRYNFATGSRFVPFIGGGVGPTLTDIRHPDLSTDFEFNVQVGAGMHWFFKPKWAATLEGRFLHLSNGGIDHPNQGVNTTLIQLGASWFF